MFRRTIRRYAIVLAAWLPFFVIWVLFAMLYAHSPLRAALLTSLISMGSASMLGIAVWHVCERWPWPFRPGLRFYVLQVFFAAVYSMIWILSVYSLESIRRGTNPLQDLLRSPLVGWQLLTGVWLYGLFAGVSYAVQTRDRLQEKETLAAHAEALAAAARLDAIRTRLNPHFLFNALHNLDALVKFPSGHGRRRHRASRRHAALYPERRRPRVG